MFKRITSFAFVFCVLFFSSGCQDKNSVPSSDLSNTKTSGTPTLVATAPSNKDGAIYVPLGMPKTIDGVISPGEWDDAEVEVFAGGSEVLLMQSDGYLFLGIRANTSEMIVGNVFVEQNDEIKIFHTSAALGTGIYQKGKEGWQLVQGFEWCCRTTSDSEFARNERIEFLQNEGWVGTNSRIGTPNEAEYQIEIPGETFRVALNYILASKTDVKIPWPDGLDDDCIKPTPGGLPDQLFFTPDEWKIVNIQTTNE